MKCNNASSIALNSSDRGEIMHKVQQYSSIGASSAEILHKLQQ